MEILLFLLVAIVVATLVFFVTTEPAPSNIDVMDDSPYPAVKIQPCKDACQAASQTAKLIFLTSQAPKLPLNACDRIGECDCQFRHYADRRRHDDRRDGRYAMRDMSQQKDRRIPKHVGRRVSDHYVVA